MLERSIFNAKDKFGKIICYVQFDTIYFSSYTTRKDTFVINC